MRGRRLLMKATVAARSASTRSSAENASLDRPTAAHTCKVPKKGAKPVLSRGRFDRGVDARDQHVGVAQGSHTASHVAGRALEGTQGAAVGEGRRARGALPSRRRPIRG